MPSADYRIESSRTIQCRLIPMAGATQYLVSSSALAIAMAAKSVTVPAGEEIRVVHVPTGEVLFRKPAAAPSRGADD